MQSTKRRGPPNIYIIMQQPQLHKPRLCSPTIIGQQINPQRGLNGYHSRLQGQFACLRAQKRRAPMYDIAASDGPSRQFCGRETFSPSYCHRFPRHQPDLSTTPAYLSLSAAFQSIRLPKPMISNLHLIHCRARDSSLSESLGNASRLLVVLSTSKSQTDHLRAHHPQRLPLLGWMVCSVGILL